MTEFKAKINSNLCIVPWFDKNEWRFVYNKLFNGESRLVILREALNHLYTWKSRVDLLPSAIEGTILILEALVKDESLFTRKELQEFYSFKLMRFLNICVASRSKQGDFKQLAKSYGIPGWVIEIRNDTAHNQHLPSFRALQVALKVCYHWLKDNYWDVEYKAKKQFVPKSKQFVKENVGGFLDIYFATLNVNNCYDLKELFVALNQLKIDNVSGKRITEENRQDVLFYIESCLPLPQSTLDELMNKIMEHIDNIVDNTTGENRNYKILDQFIIFLANNQLLQRLIESILYELQKQRKSHDILNYHSFLLARIFKSLNKSSTGVSNKNLINFSTIIERETLEILYDKAVKEPNVYTINFLQQFYLLMGFAENDFNFLREIVLLQVNGFITTQKTISEENIVKVNKFLQENNNSEQMDCEETTNQTWTVLKDTSIFQSCPLGVLPISLRHHSVENPLFECC